MRLSISRLGWLFALVLFALPIRAQETSWFGIYIQDAKIGYSSSFTKPSTLDGKSVNHSESLTVIDSAMLGSGLRLELRTVAISDESGKLLSMDSRNESAGRTQRIQAEFGEKTVELTISAGDQISKRTIEIPDGAKIVDDPLLAIGEGDLPLGSETTVYVLDPTLLELTPNVVKVVGTSTVDVRGSQFTATVVTIDDTRGITTVYLNSKGDVIKIEALLGLTMYPEPEDVAKKLGEGPAPDIAALNTITTEPKIERPMESTRLELEVRGISLSRLPSDAHQTVEQKADAWVLTVHPLRASREKSGSIAEAAKQEPDWTEPGLYVPSDDPEMKTLAKEIAGGETDVLKASSKVHAYVNGLMRPNAGIGVLRDAREVLSSGEGVCRDYAILMATLLRARDIPTRLASGLIHDGNAFYYHAWVEVWTGSQWVGLDATRRSPDLTATHVKLSQGTVEEAYTFFVLNGARIKVADIEY